jgi:hypothetical protein
MTMKFQPFYAGFIRFGTHYQNEAFGVQLIDLKAQYLFASSLHTEVNCCRTYTTLIAK